jgi:hypothetical protein
VDPNTTAYFVRGSFLWYFAHASYQTTRLSRCQHASLGLACDSGELPFQLFRVESSLHGPGEAMSAVAFADDEGTRGRFPVSRALRILEQE